MIDISAIVNVHREGALCLETLRSVSLAAKASRREGFSCEIVVVLDRSDEPTREAVASFGDTVRREECDFGDLGASRNFGVAAAQGAMIGFMDGDDLMGERWLAIAAKAALAQGERQCVIHPRYNISFGGGEPAFILMQPDMIEDAVDPRWLIFSNLWTSLAFARRDLFLAFPYPPNEIEAGFGYEDWSWNHATVSAGVAHLAPREGVHFLRRHRDGGLHMRSREAAVLPNLWPRPKG